MRDTDLENIRPRQHTCGTASKYIREYASTKNEPRTTVTDCCSNAAFVAATTFKIDNHTTAVQAADDDDDEWRASVENVDSVDDVNLALCSREGLHGSFAQTKFLISDSNCL